jgi:peptidoglycan hydrolase-like protein with peptidoglycan-binding domain
VVVFAFFNCNDGVQIPIIEQESSLTIQILTELEKRGYDVELTGETTPKNKAALTRFQKDHGLPSFCGGGEQVLEFLKTEPVLKDVRGKEMILKGQMALKEKGYDVKTTRIMDSKTKIALGNFQKDNGLPIACGGHSMIMLLQALGIDTNFSENK